MESTEQNRVWHTGSPPYVGWWQASALDFKNLWRWWNGRYWSTPAATDDCLEEVCECANSQTPTEHIRWNDYWPTAARVPRLAPEDFEIGARWVCADPQWKLHFRGLEFSVVGFGSNGVTLHSYRSNMLLHWDTLPSEYYVPRRCVGPQTRWDFPMPKGGRCG